MDKTYYEFDPQGDVELLVDPTQGTLLAKSGYLNSKSTLEKASPKKRKLEESETSEQSYQTGATNSNANDSEHTEKVRMRVSSKVLSLASSYFRGMLQGGFKEAQDLRSGHLVQVSTENCKTKALLILLSIFHFYGRDVPESIDFETAFEMACLVDMWLCHDATIVHVKSWIIQLTETWSSSPESLAFWVFIAWVFKEQTLFKQATARLIREANDEVKNDLPISIPEYVIRRINQERLAYIKRTVRKVYEAFTQLSGGARCNLSQGHTVCCSCAKLGDLVKAMLAVGLPLDSQMKPKPPFSGFTAARLLQTMGDEGTQCPKFGKSLIGRYWSRGPRTVDRTDPTSFGLNLEEMVQDLVKG